jgi:hypothetical protein
VQLIDKPWQAGWVVEVTSRITKEGGEVLKTVLYFDRFRPDGELETLSVLEEPPEAFFYEEGAPLLAVGKKLEKLFPNVLLHPFRRPLDRETLDFMHHIAYENLEAAGLLPKQREVQTHH